MADERLKRPCDVCLEVDDHPRHVHGLAPDDPNAVAPNDTDFELVVGQPGVSAASLQQFLDPLTQIRHLDCCADKGCPTGTCGPQLEAADHAHGDELLAAIQKEG